MKQRAEKQAEELVTAQRDKETVKKIRRYLSVSDKRKQRIGWFRFWKR